MLTLLVSEASADSTFMLQERESKPINWKYQGEYSKEGGYTHKGREDELDKKGNTHPDQVHNNRASREQHSKRRSRRHTPTRQKKGAIEANRRTT
jgi:hypothetical protein